MELDLKELAARESEQVEWKENVADIDDVVATLSAFANDWANLGGGYVVCGAREGQDEHGFARVHTPGLTAARLKEIEGKVMGRCRERVDPPLTPLVREVTGDDPSRRVLVFIMPATGHAHSFRRGPARGPGSDSGKYYIRRSRSTEEARNGLFRELLVRKGALPPWAERPHPRAGVDAIDLLVLRDTLQRISQWDPDVPADEYLDEGYRISEFVPSLCVAEPLTGVLRPRNASLLLFGRDVLGFFPSAYVSFAVYPGPNRSERHSESVLVRGPLFEQVRTLKELMVPHTRRAHDKGDRAHPNLTTYPTRAVDEAIVNALVHRDYEIDDPIHVTVFSNRIEIVSPGALPSRVERERFLEGKATPSWRDLAWFCRELDIAQALGQGIRTIRDQMRDAGCPPPEFELGEQSVACVLWANPRAARSALLLEVDGPIEIPTRLGITSIIELTRAGARSPVLRALPPDELAWEALMAEIDRGIELALESTRGELHVFGMAPYAAAAFLGRRLDDLARARAVRLHQLTPESGGWEELERTEDPTGPTPYFEPLREPPEAPDSTIPLLAIDGMHPIDESRCEPLAESLGATVYHLRAQSPAPMRPGQFAGASMELRRALSRLAARHPGAPLHVITSAPVALIIELGRLLSPSVFSSAIIHHFSPSSSSYVPVLDVVGRTVISSGP